MKIVDSLLDLLFPPKCILCGKLLEEEIDLCRRCRVEAPRYPQRNLKLQFLDSYTAIWYYEGSVRKSLHRYKFQQAWHLSEGYGKNLAMCLLEAHPEGFDCITWVPISPLRKFFRGYDQDELLAKVVGRELEIPVIPMLQKIRNNPPQSGIRGTAQRRANVLGIYRVCSGEGIPGKRILLVDDILTTGATAGECARVLLTAGAGEVHCATVAAARK